MPVNGPIPKPRLEFEKETPSQAFGVAVPLELGGKRSKRIAVSQATIRAGEAELAATIAQVRTDVRRAYHRRARRRGTLTVLQELRDLSRRVRDTAQTRFDAGDVPRLEVLQADLALAAAENEASAAEGAPVAARTRLNALLGQPLDAARRSRRRSTPVAASPAVAALNLARASEHANSRSSIAGSSEQRAKLTLAQALRTPDIIPTATLTHDAEPEFTYGWRAGLAVTLPVFTTHKAGVRVEQTTLDQLMASDRRANSALPAT